METGTRFPYRVITSVSMLVFIVNVVMAFMRPKDQPNDPWEANTLEWWTTSPPPVHNFPTPPVVDSDPYGYGERPIPMPAEG